MAQCDACVFKNNCISLFICLCMSIHEKMNCFPIHTDEGDEFVLENFRPSVANKIKLEVCLYFAPKDKHV